jgi:uncharacterized protein (TIGR02246 family)
MKRTFTVVVMIVAAATLALGQTKSKPGAGADNSVREALIALEKQAWEAWKTKDAKFFQGYLTDDSINVRASGIVRKAEILKEYSSLTCEIRSYSLDNFDVVMLDPNTAILTVKANQDVTCGGQALPATVWAATVYVKRGGKWQSVFYQETPATTSQ